MKKLPQNIKIYKKLLKYPPFVCQRRAGIMEIVHNLTNGGSVTIIAPEAVTTEDGEKLYVLCYIAQKNNTCNLVETEKFGTIAELTCNINEIRKIVNNNDDKSIVNSLKRITGITIAFDFKNKKRTLHIISDTKYNAVTGEINVLMSLTMFNNFIKRPFNIDIENYAKLSPVGKNLYCYIVSNSARDFTEKLLIERAVIRSSRYNDCQRTLKKALDELKEKHIIKDFETKKNNGQRHIIINKYGEKTLSVALAKHYP